jgi:hypothetical protein
MRVNTSALRADYGEDVTSAGPALRHLRMVARADDALSVQDYYHRVRRACHIGATHGDLITVAYNHWSPVVWAPRVGEWLAYWCQVDRYRRGMGSPYTPRPQLVWHAWRAGVPAWAAQALWAPISLGEYPAGHSVRMPRRITRGRYRRLIQAARAARRASVQGRLHIDEHALSALGRLSPELQRAALEGVESRQGGAPLRMRYLNWARAAEVQAQIQHDPTGRVRAAWAGQGRRRELLGLAPDASPHAVAVWLVGQEAVYAYVSDWPRPTDADMERWAARLVRERGHG